VLEVTKQPKVNTADLRRTQEGLVPTTSCSAAGRRWTAATLSAFVLVVVTGCTSGGTESGAEIDPSASSQAAAASPTGPKMLQPGRPGETASTLAPDAELPDPEWTGSDVAFMQMMIPHHAQALEMAALAKTRADDEQVKAVARRISAAQGPEVIAMSSWLRARGLEVAAGGHEQEHGDTAMMMPGMLSEPEMRQLASSRGARFDRLFLEGMMSHHEGAVQMAGAVAVEGIDIQVSEVAAEVDVGQTAEIGRMRELLEGL